MKKHAGNNNNTKKGGAFNLITKIINNPDIIKLHNNVTYNYTPYTHIYEIDDNKYNKILETYNLTNYIDSLNNNKVIYNCCATTGGRTGGRTGEAPETVIEYITKNPTLLENLKTYCKNYYNDESNQDPNQAIALICEELEKDDLLPNAIKEYNYLKGNLPDMVQIIKNNRTKYNIEYKIPIQKIDVNNYISSISKYAPLTDSFPISFIREYTYYDFNKDNILGYQGLQLDLFEQNKSQIEKYIEEQNNYLLRLSPQDKRILVDYTRFKSFTLYQEYVKAQEQNFEKGDIVANFLETINKYYPEKKGKNNKETLLTNMSNAFIDIIDELQIFNIIPGDLNKGYDDNADERYFQISNNDWKRIFELYLKKLNDIILNAPPVPVKFVCYRGVSNDYTLPGTNSVKGHPVFISTRTGSISLNFDKSKEYYDKGTDPAKRTMYRILVVEGCKILFVTPLAGKEIIDEMELITPSNQVFISDTWEVTTAYNNIYEKNNICFPEYNKINSKDLILLPHRQEDLVTL